LTAVALKSTQPARRTATPPDIGQLFARHGADVLRVVYAATGRHDVADDIVQEVFIFAHQHREELVDTPRIRFWLNRVAMNKVRHYWRSRSRYRDVMERFKRDVPRFGSATPEQDLSRREHAMLIQKGILAIPETFREVFVLFEQQGFSGAQIAEMLDISVNTVWTRLHRARAAFRAHMRESIEEKP